MAHVSGRTCECGGTMRRNGVGQLIHAGVHTGDVQDKWICTDCGREEFLPRFGKIAAPERFSR